MSRGKLIVIEGASDGIGKTTQFNLLKEKLEENNKVITHHFPSHGTLPGSLVTGYLHGDFGEISDLSPYLVTSFYAADRGIVWNMELEEAYSNGNVILLDRYTTSSLIYQSALIKDEKEKKEFIDYVMDLEYNKIGIKSPDEVIFLFAPFDIITEMRRKRKEQDGEIVEGDIHENNLKFMKDVYDSAIFVAEYLGWTFVNCVDDNGLRSIDDIHKEIVNDLRGVCNVRK